jgi:hypothetical protein
LRGSPRPAGDGFEREQSPIRLELVILAHRKQEVPSPANQFPHRRLEASPIYGTGH